MKPFLTGIALVALTAIGFATGIYFDSLRQTTGPAMNVLARCAIVADDDVKGDELRIRCGLDEEGIDGVLRDALAQLGIDDLRGEEDLDTEAMQHAADRLGLNMEALTTLLDDIRSGDDVAGDPATEGRAKQVGVALEVGVGGGPGAPPEETGGEQSAPMRLTDRVALAIKPPVTAPEKEAREIAAECAVASGGEIEIGRMDLECGPDAAEVDALIGGLVDEAGVAGIRAALSKDTETRARFVAELADALKLSDETVETLVAELEQVEASDGEVRARLSEAVRDRIQLSLMLLQVGQMAETLRARQSEAADAIVAGDLPEARGGLRAAGQTMRPLADSLAPPTLPPLAASASLALEAQKLAEDGAFREAAAAFDRAAAATEGGWQVVADAFRLSAAQMAAAAGYRERDAELSQIAVDRQLSAADGFSNLALDAALSASTRLRELGKDQMAGEDLDRALAVLRRLEPQVDPESDPGRYAALQSGVAGILWRLGQRSADNGQLLEAEAAAASALDAAEELDAPAQLANVLIDWGNVQVELGNRTGDVVRIDKAIDAYQRASEAIDPETDLHSWLTTRINIAVTYSSKSRLERDPDILDQAAAIYRDALRRLDKDADGDLWALAKGNLAGVLHAQGNQKNDSRLRREAAAAFEETLAYYTPDAAPYAWAHTMRALAEVWTDIGVEDEDPAALEKAAGTIEEVVAAYDPDVTPRPWAVAKYGLGNVYYSWGMIEPGTGKFRIAAKAYGDASAIMTVDAAPAYHGRLVLYRAYALHRAGLDETEAGLLDDAREAAEQALAVFRELKGGQPDRELDGLIADGTALLAEIERDAGR